MVARKFSEFTQANGVSGDDILLVTNDPQGTPSTVSVSVVDLFSNNNVDFVCDKTLYTNNFIITTSNTPLTSTVNSSIGTITFDTNYLYITVANNTIKRIPLQSF